jgi:hypothetical protein
MSGSMLAATASSRKFTEANALAQWKLEEALLLPGPNSNPPSAVWNVNVTDYCSLQLVCTATPPTTSPDDTNYYTRALTWADDSTDGNKTITVNVQWPGPSPTHQISIANERNPLP